MNNQQSIWNRIDNIPRYPAKPPGNEACEVLIVGGGITGMLCAYRLLQKGIRNVILIEKDRLGQGTTGYTSAKITAQHNLIYKKLSVFRGDEVAKRYFNSNLEAIEEYARIIKAHGIDCDFERKDAWLYTSNSDLNQLLRKEEQALLKIGGQAEFTLRCPLPVRTCGGLVMRNQAQFHPLRFLYGLANIVSEMGLTIYEQTKAVQVDSQEAVTDRGTITAKHIVLCTRFPLLNKAGMMFAKLYQSRSYLLALAGAQDPGGMFLNIEKGGLSFRAANDERYGRIVLLGGFGHKTGHEGGRSHYEKLITQAQLCYPKAKMIAQWSAQDSMSHDGISYIGRLSPKYKNVYLAAGYNKWGMTTAMTAARIMTDLIAGDNNRSAALYSIRRAGAAMRAGSQFVHSADAAGDIAAGLVTPGKQNGRCLRCTHMGGKLRHNEDENSWDCPAHGSRFGSDGEVLEHPAVSALHKEK